VGETSSWAAKQRFRPCELQSVGGIGPKRRERIAQAWREAKQIREIMLFLHSHGVSTSRAVRIFKTYGEKPDRAICAQRDLVWGFCSSPRISRPSNWKST
jgi:Helix-hairpin-helix containing domain